MSPRALIFGDPQILRPVHRVVACAGAEIMQLDDLQRLVPQAAAAQPRWVLFHLEHAGDCAPQALRQVHQVCPEAALILLGTAPTPIQLKALLDEPWLAHIFALESPWLMADLTATLTKLQGADLFGLDRYMPWGTRLLSHKLTSNQEKGLIFDAIEDLLGGMGIGGRVVPHLHAIADELLMNALYDAPVDGLGQPKYTGRAKGDVITLQPHEQPTVHIGSDGRRFGISVTDPFGGLTAATLRRYVGKGLRREADQIDTKPGGAGLGLYMLFNAVHTLCLNLAPSRCTQVIGLVDIQGSFRHIAGGPRALSLFSR